MIGGSKVTYGKENSRSLTGWKGIEGDRKGEKWIERDRKGWEEIERERKE